ncbi:hypothetical protein BKA64DRAFT_726639 [Cadophora sp. MPI-SDFR-AT-0126]|nr:hypothetical protein BKA64DRAFT_726639 [Leotiomycetes sp. MPI-SDFR-AT-0126]
MASLSPQFDLTVRPKMDQMLPIPRHQHERISYTTSPAAWNGVRSEIKRLYIDEGRSRKDVMAIMEKEYGHRGTDKMYKRWFEKWNFGKNLKKSEAVTIYRLDRQRAAQGKRTVWGIRGKQRNIEDIVRPLKKKGLLDRVENGQFEDNLPSGIECWTPGSSPKPTSGTIALYGGDGAMDLDQEVVEQILFCRDPSVPTLDIPATPTTPQGLLVQQNLLRSIQIYFEGGLENGIFYASDDGELVLCDYNVRVGQYLADFEDLHQTGVKLIETSRGDEGRRCLSRAFSLVRSVITAQDPNTMSRIFYLVLRLESSHHDDLSVMLRKFLANIAHDILPNHPWNVLFAQLAQLGGSGLKATILEAWRCTCDITRAVVDQFGVAAIDSQTDYLVWCDPQESIYQLSSLLSIAESRMDSVDERLMWIKYSYAQVLEGGDQVEKAIAVLDGLVESLRCGLNDDNQQKLARTLRQLAVPYHKDYRDSEAESAFREAISILETSYGRDDARALEYKATLARYLEEWGRREESEAMYAEMDQIIGPDDIEITAEMREEARRLGMERYGWS